MWRSRKLLHADGANQGRWSFWPNREERPVFRNACENHNKITYGGRGIFAPGQYLPPRLEAWKFNVWGAEVVENQIDRFWFCRKILTRGKELLQELGFSSLPQPGAHQPPKIQRKGRCLGHRRHCMPPAHWWVHVRRPNSFTGADQYPLSAGHVRQHPMEGHKPPGAAIRSGVPDQEPG